MAATKINATPAEIRSRATDVRKLKDEHDQAITKLGQLLRDMSEVYEGEAQKQIVTEYDNMKTLFDNFSNLIETYAKTLEDNAEEIEQEDIRRGQKNAKILGNFYTA